MGGSILCFSVRSRHMNVLKNMRRRVIPVIIPVILLTCHHVGAAAADGEASATIDSSLQLYKTTDLNFGSIVPGSSSGTVTLLPSGSYSYVGPLALVAGTPRVAAAFMAYGQMHSTFTITLPDQIEITNSGGDVMTVDTFTSDPSGTGTLYTTYGNQGGPFFLEYPMKAIHVGATLYVNAEQAVGVYTGEFSIMIDYQ